MRVGIGYDAHRLGQGRKLVIGGVDIPHSQGLIGHSDADVLIHALCDALLGAVGLGDIGDFFPSDNPQYAGKRSTFFLQECHRLLAEKGFRVGNVDAVIIAEGPKMKDYTPAMRRNIADILETGIDAVSIKATTEDGMGFTGRKEGIAAWVVVTIKEK